jgi:prepilin peptidase CpaA
VPHAGWLFPASGILTGFLAMFPLYLIRAVGAGDVKLMAMAGSLLGPQEVWPALVGSIVAGGLFALLLSLWRGKLGTMLGNVGRMLHLGSVALAAGIAVSPATTGWQSVGRLPFALPIAVGSISAVTANYFGFL